MAENGKTKALDTTLANLRKRFGEGTIMKLGEAEGMKVEAIPTGALSLDLALGIGGVPRGRITEIYGPESSGKTTICQHIIAEAQRMGGIAAFVDVEHTLDPSYAVKVRCQCRRSVRVATRHRRTGARDRGSVDPLGRNRRGSR